MANNTDPLNDLSRKQYYYPNRMGRVIFLAMEEILGQAGVNALLKSSNLPVNIQDHLPADQDFDFPFSYISDLLVGLENSYGPQAGRGLALRVGRSCLKYDLREFARELCLTDLAFRLLPLQTKLSSGTEAFAALFNNHTDQQVRLDKDEKHIFWHIQRCPFCWERQSEGPCCHLEVGFLQEAVYWISGGKYFEVEEKKCIACGDSVCTIYINRTPVS
jgi:predicted hydrocarbon binding protein